MWFKLSFTTPAVAAMSFCLIGGTSTASADLIYDNDGPGGTSAYSNILTDAFGGIDRRIADDFILVGGPGWVVNNVEMNYVWATVGVIGTATEFLVQFYADDAGGGPGTLISEQVSSSFTATPTGVIFFSREEVIFSVDIVPVAFDADTNYWVSIQPNGDDNGYQLTSHHPFVNGQEAYVQYAEYGPDWVPTGVQFGGGAADMSFRLNGEAGPGTCPWDLDDSSTVGASDLLALLVAWGPCPNQTGCPADFDGDGNVGASDLLTLLVNWGPCP